MEAYRSAAAPKVNTAFMFFICSLFGANDVVGGSGRKDGFEWRETSATEGPGRQRFGVAQHDLLARDCD